MEIQPTPTLELIHRHGSVRKYKSLEVPKELIETVIQAGQRASTSSNLQAYSVIAVQDSETRSRLAILCGNQEFINQAPVFLVWCADLHRLDQVCYLQGYTQETGYLDNFLVPVIDAALASQVAGLAAESFGLGFCYVGGIRNNPLEVIKLLELPEFVFPVVGMTLGFPSQEVRTRPRLPLEAVLHWEKYHTENQDVHLQAYDQAMIATGIYVGRQASSVDTVANEPRPYGWLEHSALRVSKAHRTGLSVAVQAQGFGLK